MHIKLFLSLALLCFSVSSTAESISLYAEDAYFPFSNKDGTGLSNRIVQEAYQAVGVDVTFDVMPFVRMMEYLENGVGLGGFNAVPIASEKEKYLFGKEPFYQVKTYLYFNKKRPITAKTINEFNKEKYIVGEVRGYMYDGLYQSITAERYYTNSDEQLIKMLLSGRIDSAILTGGATERIAQRLGRDASQLQRVKSYGVAVVPMHVAFNIKHPKAKHYADLLDRGIALLKSSGRYEKIVNMELPQIK